MPNTSYIHRSTASLGNEQMAAALSETADLMEYLGANPFRTRAYRNAAHTIRSLDRSVESIFREEGTRGLERLPGIGHGLAKSLEQMVRSGRLPLLERLRNENAGDDKLLTVPNIGPKLAQRIHEQLGIDDLFELQVAANDGRLAKVPGMGIKRLRSVRESLAGRFSRRAQLHPTQARSESLECVSIHELLNVDREYRRLAKQNLLPKIAPRQFNPTREAWLPVLKTERGMRKYTAMYSNTARAHELGTTKDWVVLYLNDKRFSGCWTVITSRFGPWRGRRIVSGREDECARFYTANQPRLLFDLKGEVASKRSHHGTIQA